jgi:uncharacterized protein (DUF433 family)
MNWKNRITVDPNILVGKPIIKGTRILVELILDRLADGWTIENILTAYPHLTRADVLAVCALIPAPLSEDKDVRRKQLHAFLAQFQADAALLCYGRDELYER